MLLKKSPAIKGDLPKPFAEEVEAGTDQTT